MQIIPENKNVSSLLSTRCQFEIPRFQRDYSWEKKHYQEFIDDMLGNLKFDNNHFEVIPSKDEVVFNFLIDNLDLAQKLQKATTTNSKI